MLLPVEFAIGLRYVRSARRTARRNRFISFISWLSAAGIGLGVAALIVVLSVMNGFQKEVRDRMLSVLAHVEVRAASEGGLALLGEWPRLAEHVGKDRRVQGAAPFVAAQAMVARGDALRGVIVRGIDPKAERSVSDVAAQTRQGSLDALVPGEFGVVIGGEMARGFGLQVGDRLTLVAPQGTVTPAGVVPRVKAFTVVGIFESGHFEYDSSLVLTALDDAATLFRTGGPTGLRLRIDDMQQAPQVAADIATRLPPDLVVSDWSRENRTWFAAVQVEKRLMFVILTLIVAVAAFNLVSMLVMTVTDKQADIAILRTLGATPGAIQRIFVVQGAVIGAIGVAAGVALGCAVALSVGDLVAFVERVAGLQFLPPGVYFIRELPSDLRAEDVTRIGTTALLLSFVATIYPSWRAARTRPAEALRHE